MSHRLDVVHHVAQLRWMLPLFGENDPSKIAEPTVNASAPAARDPRSGQRSRRCPPRRGSRTCRGARRERVRADRPRSPDTRADRHPRILVGRTPGTGARPVPRLHRTRRMADGSPGNGRYWMPDPSRIRRMSVTCVPPISRSTPISTAARALRRHASAEVLTTSRYVVTPLACIRRFSSVSVAESDTDVLEPGVSHADVSDRVPRVEAVDDGLVGPVSMKMKSTSPTIPRAMSQPPPLIAVCARVLTFSDEGKARRLLQQSAVQPRRGPSRRCARAGATDPRADRSTLSPCCSTSTACCCPAAATSTRVATARSRPRNRCTASSPPTTSSTWRWPARRWSSTCRCWRCAAACKCSTSSWAARWCKTSATTSTGCASTR